MSLWKSPGGMLAVELTSADLTSSLMAINNQNVVLYEVVQINELTVRFLVSRQKYPMLNVLAKKRGENLRVLQKRGLYWSFLGVIHRPFFAVGMMLLFVMMLYLPTRILFVEVEGNCSIPSKEIIEAAGKCGIQFGASRREVRSEKVKNALLAELPQLQWAGVNTSGCVARISVKERTLEENTEEQWGVGNVVALRDGYILSVTATQGTVLCKPGQAVTEGQTLISGYTDCGICIQATRAEGEVFAQTNRKFTVLTPSTYVRKCEPWQEKKKISVIIGKKRINLWKDSGIWDASCGRMYKEYYITLPGEFRLPIAFCVETYLFCETIISEALQQPTEDMLSDYAEVYLKEQMLAGNILKREQTCMKVNGTYYFEGEYICAEMIGRVQLEQIGDTNGKSG